MKYSVEIGFNGIITQSLEGGRFPQSNNKYLNRISRYKDRMWFV